jgi:hypothetical protein
MTGLLALAAAFLAGIFVGGALVDAASSNVTVTFDIDVDETQEGRA